MASRELSAQAAREARESLLDTIAALVFVCLPLSVQAITLPALSQASKQWAEEQRAKKRALEEAKNVEIGWEPLFDSFWVPLWAAQQR